MRKDKLIVLKDGFGIGCNKLALNVNKDRRYYITYKGKQIYNNLLYCEVLGYLGLCRLLAEVELI